MPGGLTGRSDLRKLLFVHHGLRGLSLPWLPCSDVSLASPSQLGLLHGLDSMIAAMWRPS